MKRTTLFTILAGTLLLMSFLGCGATNKLQSVTLTPVGSGGFVNLKGEGSTLQFHATANYTNNQGVDVSNDVTYAVTVASPGQDDQGLALLLPPQTVTMSPTGLMTAVEPWVCTWTDMNSANDRPPSSEKPSWFLTGSYKVVATFRGVQSNPAYVGVAVSAGNGPAGECGP